MDLVYPSVILFPNVRVIFESPLNAIFHPSIPSFCPPSYIIDKSGHSGEEGKLMGIFIYGLPLDCTSI